MKSFVIGAAFCLLAGCASVPQVSPSKPNTGDSFTSYMSDNMERFPDYKTSDYQLYVHSNEQKSLGIDEGIALFRPFLKTFCDFNSGQMNTDIKLDQSGKYESDKFLGGFTNGGLDNCVFDGWVIAGLGYGKSSDNILNSISVYYPAKWEEAMQALEEQK